MDRSIDASGVAAARFTSLAGIIVNAGAGNDSILGSTNFGESLNGGDGLDTVNAQGSDGNEGTDSLNDATSIINEAFTFSAAVLIALEEMYFVQRRHSMYGFIGLKTGWN